MQEMSLLCNNRGRTQRRYDVDDVTCACGSPRMQSIKVESAPLCYSLASAGGVIRRIRYNGIV